MENQAALLAVVEAFRIWRDQRKTMAEPVPAHLRQQAAAISGQYKRSHITSALGVSGSQYSKWLHEFKDIGQQDKVAFITLPAEPHFPHSKMRLHHPSGTRLEFDGISELQLACVIRTLLEVA